MTNSSPKWLRSSVMSLCALAAVSILVGFIWLPSAQGDFSAQGLWASICRAAGVPAEWGETQHGTEVRPTLHTRRARARDGQAGL